jgi:hypothetical protein
MLAGTTVANPQAGPNCIANSKASKMVSDFLTLQPYIRFDYRATNFIPCGVA